MKKIVLNVFVFIALIFAMSCFSNDDSGSNDSDTTVTITWKLISLLAESSLDIDNNEITSNALLLESDCYLNETI